ncbi:MAG: head GIN domain-containing protein [Parvularculaceae bacterium]
MKSLHVASASLAAGAALLAGSASAETKSFDLPAFDEIDASAGVDVNVSVGGAQSVIAENENGDFDDLVLEVRRGELRASRKNKRFGFGKRERYKIVVTMPALEGIEISSGADADVTGVNADHFSIDGSSGADADIAGTCKTLDIDVSSGANINASDLICEVATVDVSSGGNAKIHATQRLNADASSGGHATVYGKPEYVDIDKSSGGGVSVRN